MIDANSSTRTKGGRVTTPSAQVMTTWIVNTTGIWRCSIAIRRKLEALTLLCPDLVLNHFTTQALALVSKVLPVRLSTLWSIDSPMPLCSGIGKNPARPRSHYLSSSWLSSLGCHSPSFSFCILLSSTWSTIAATPLSRLRSSPSCVWVFILYSAPSCSLWGTRRSNGKWSRCGAMCSASSGSRTKKRQDWGIPSTTTITSTSNASRRSKKSSDWKVRSKWRIMRRRWLQSISYPLSRFKK